MMTNRTQTKIKSQERQTQLLSRHINSETDSHRLWIARVHWYLSTTELLVNKLYLKVLKKSSTEKKMKVRILRKASRLKVRISWRRKIESLWRSLLRRLRSWTSSASPLCTKKLYKTWSL
jgi:hypothetical protein